MRQRWFVQVLFYLVWVSIIPLSSVLAQPDQKLATALETQLKRCIQQNDIQAFNSRLGGDFTIPAADANGKTALMYAAEAGNLEVVSQLIQLGKDGETWICADGSDLKKYLNRCEKVSAKTRGYNALMYASEHGHTDIVNYLLNAGADATTRCQFGQFTALQIAQNAGQMETAHSLERALDEEKKQADESKTIIPLLEKKVVFPFFENNGAVIALLVGTIIYGINLLINGEYETFKRLAKIIVGCVILFFIIVWLLSK